MAKFKSGEKKKVPQMSTSSMPDIVFMLLFFFMITTTMKENDIKVENTPPQATQIKKLEKKSLASYIFVGQPKPNYRGIYGTATRIQLNDRFATVDDIMAFISTERDALSELDQRSMTTMLKADENVRMGTVTDIKQALRRANALKFGYNAKKPEQQTDF
ncbi:MAG: biopolymer transporter ExbD [Bacteroidales bacterium]|nr:biopolymer transporter ExbD [Bacteroidales bacterium]MBR3287782.1 biopolymer transporter ExbD [Bacteroidales bacterium]